MTKPSSFDAQALIDQFRHASQRQGDALRDATRQATLQALQSRELTLKGVRDAVRQVAAAATRGAKDNERGTETDKLLSRAVEGMDAALRQAVQAQQHALQQLEAQGADLRERPFKKALADLEKMEAALFDGIGKAAEKALAMPWASALGGVRESGSATGQAAADAVQRFGAQAQQALRDGRANGQQAAEALFEHYAAMATGVLIGLSQAMAPSAAADKPPRARKA